MDAHGLVAEEVVPASRKLGEAKAKELIRAVQSITVAKGKKLTEFEGGRATAEAVASLLGPTGNLRAPTVLVGDKLLVGFNEEAYLHALG